MPAALQIAGDAFATRVNVADRSERSTPVLLGRDDLRRFRISVGEQLLTTPGEPQAPSALGSLLAQSSALGPTALLAVLPLAALVIVVLRVVFGLQTLGAFSPVLLAIGYSQAGLVPGLLLTIGMFILGFAAQPLLRRLRLPRVVRLSALVGVVAVALVTLQEAGGVSSAVDSWGASLPVVVTAIIVERLWETWELDGLSTAVWEAVLTLGVAALVALVILAPAVRLLADTIPIQLAAVRTIWACIIGTYRGLRISELLRFRDSAASTAPSRSAAGSPALTCCSASVPAWPARVSTACGGPTTAPWVSTGATKLGAGLIQTQRGVGYRITTTAQPTTVGPGGPPGGGGTRGTTRRW